MKKLFSLVIFFCLFFLLVGSTNAQIITTEKLITVDIANQTLTAWDNGQIVNQTKVSTGLRYTPTIRGSFKILRKVSAQDMRGHFPPNPPYFVKNVPSVMYFYGAYAIHGAYWHNNFGVPMSNGCVNVPVNFSNWLYEWSSVGTRVEVF
jgi:lipoprotein-anchoring transpeptidase ErfK/SrfK